jgi:hypothetical protein
MVAVPSLPLADDQFLQGNLSEGAAVTIAGKLRLPAGPTPFPVVVLLHGTDGPASGAVGSWSNFLNGWAWQPVGRDSYTGRGIKEASTDQSPVAQFTSIYDT